MFAFLRGRVAGKPLGRVHLDVGGVGYDVHVPELVSRRLTVDTTVTLLTYCHIREDAFQIFGFLREEEKALFEALLSVNGVGPKVALAVMSAMSVQQFAQAVRDSDINAFTRTPGVGKKTAQRIVLEIKSRMGQETELSALLGEEEKGAERLEEDDDVVAALCAMGCTLGEAKKAVQGARKDVGEGASVETQLKAALARLRKV